MAFIETRQIESFMNACTMLAWGVLDLNKPKKFSEKRQWLKLYYRKPELTEMVDKYKVKEVFSKKIGAEHVVPLYGVWDRAKDIDFESLPNQFV